MYMQGYLTEGSHPPWATFRVQPTTTIHCRRNSTGARHREQSQKAQPNSIKRLDVAGYALLICQSRIDRIGEWGRQGDGVALRGKGLSFLFAASECCTTMAAELARSGLELFTDLGVHQEPGARDCGMKYVPI